MDIRVKLSMKEFSPVMQRIIACVPAKLEVVYASVVFLDLESRIVYYTCGAREIIQRVTVEKERVDKKIEKIAVDVMKFGAIIASLSKISLDELYLTFKKQSILVEVGDYSFKIPLNSLQQDYDISLLRTAVEVEEKEKFLTFLKGIEKNLNFVSDDINTVFSSVLFSKDNIGVSFDRVSLFLSRSDFFTASEGILVRAEDLRPLLSFGGDIDVGVSVGKGKVIFKDKNSKIVYRCALDSRAYPDISRYIMGRDADGVYFSVGKEELLFSLSIMESIASKSIDIVEWNLKGEELFLGLRGYEGGQSVGIGGDRADTKVTVSLLGDKSIWNFMSSFSKLLVLLKTMEGKVLTISQVFSGQGIMLNDEIGNETCYLLGVRPWDTSIKEDDEKV